MIGRLLQRVTLVGPFAGRRALTFRRPSISQHRIDLQVSTVTPERRGWPSVAAPSAAALWALELGSGGQKQVLAAVALLHYFVMERAFHA